MGIILVSKSRIYFERGKKLANKDFISLAKARYEDLLKQKQEIDKELKPLQSYLQNAGVLKKARRGRKPRA